MTCVHMHAHNNRFLINNLDLPILNIYSEQLLIAESLSFHSSPFQYFWSS